MLLGVYFHLAINYVGEPPGGHPLFGLFMFLCHYFRMHAFFLVSGFFGALLVNRRGAKEMIKNRVNKSSLSFISTFLSYLAPPCIQW